MKLKSNQSGIAHVALILGVIVIAVIGLVGWKVYEGQNKADTTDTPTKSSSSTKSPATSPATTESTNITDADIDQKTTGWTTVAVAGGEYSFKYKPGWTVATGGDYTPGAAFINDTAGTIGLESPVRVGLYSQAGDKRSENYGATGQNMGDRVDKTEDVTLNGVAGKRYELTATTQGPLTPPVKNEKYVVYSFYTNDRTYVFYYTEQPGQTDFLSDFELLVRSVVFAK